MKQVIDSIEKLKNTFMECANMLRKGKPLNITVDYASRIKSKSQLGFVFGLLFNDIYNYLLECGEFGEISKERALLVIREYLYKRFSKEDTFYIGDMPITIYARISDMNLNEMTAFIDKVLKWCDKNEIPLQPACRYTWILHLDKDYIRQVKNKPMPKNDSDYLAYIRKSHCIVCGKFGCDAHHSHGKANQDGFKKDYLAVPVCHSCHVKQDGHINTCDIEKKASRVLNGLDLITFAKVCYDRFKSLTPY